MPEFTSPLSKTTPSRDKPEHKQGVRTSRETGLEDKYESLREWDNTNVPSKAL